MTGSHSGGLKGAKTIKDKYGDDFYKKIGSIGGRKGTTGGFYDKRPRWQKILRPKNPIAVEAGRLGGRISKRA